jgi:ABC-type uncharacterized transport system permease subunit
MGNASSHSAAGLGGGMLGASILALLVAHFHMDPAIASAWITVVAGIIGGPLLAYVSVKSKSDPALAAALAALNAAGDAPPTVEATPQQTVVTNPPPAAQPLAVPPPVAPPPTGPAADPASQMAHGAIDAPVS